jgi:hypothetical protein
MARRHEQGDYAEQESYTERSPAAAWIKSGTPAVLVAMTHL